MNILILGIGCILSSFLFLIPLHEVTAQSLPDFNFVAVGDWSCNEKTESTVTSILEKNPEVILGLGDYSYEDTADCWLEIVEPIEDKLKISFGNHDVQYQGLETENQELRQQYFKHFNLEKEYYSFDFQNVHFIVLSTEPYHIEDPEQHTFLETDLQGAKENQDIDWIVVFYHKLAYTSPNNVLGAHSELRDPYHQVFEKYGVDLVLQGHLHAYERSYPIKFNPEDPSNPIITDNSTNNYFNPEGQIYASVGTGGAHLHNFMGQKAPYMISQYLGWGFLNIDIIDEGKILIGKFYSNDGTVLDQFGIAK